MAGRTSNVSTVDETRPPMTTRASGRWISEPIPCDNAAGRRGAPHGAFPPDHDEHVRALRG